MRAKNTNRDVFLAGMAAVVPWVAVEALIEPHYPRLVRAAVGDHFHWP
jgi:hypothetical protein